MKKLSGCDAFARYLFHLIVSALRQQSVFHRNLFDEIQLSRSFRKCDKKYQHFESMHFFHTVCIYISVLWILVFDLRIIILDQNVV